MYVWREITWRIGKIVYESKLRLRLIAKNQIHTGFKDGTMYRQFRYMTVLSYYIFKILNI